MQIAILWLAIIVMVQALFQRSKYAGWLLVPYLSWVGFAASLSSAIWRLN